MTELDELKADNAGEASRRAREVLLNRTPAQSLALHDAEVLEEAGDES